MDHEAVESNEVVGVAVDLLGQSHLFFTRIEAKCSVILGVNTGMIWFLAAKLPRVKRWDPPMLVALLALALIAASLIQLYRCSFPQLKGGRESLTCFKQIAERTQGSYLADFAKQTQQELALDLLGQVWQNSQILTSKIHSLRSAYALCALAVLPWGVAIVGCVTR